MSGATSFLPGGPLSQAMAGLGSAMPAARAPAANIQLPAVPAAPKAGAALGAPATSTPAPKTGNAVPEDFFSSYSSSIDSAMQGLKQAEQTEANLKAPEQYSLPSAPVEQTTSPIKAWSSAAMFVAALGSLLTRRPMTTAIQSAAAVLNAYGQKDASTFKDAMDVWKTNTANALKMQEFELQRYTQAIAKAGDNVRGASSAVTSLMYAMKDEVGLQVYKTQGLDGVKNLIFDRATKAKAAGEATAKTVQMGLEQADWLDWQQKHPDATAPQRDAAHKRIMSMTISDGVKQMTPAQRMSIGRSFYTTMYPSVTDPATGKVSRQDASGNPAPSFDDFLKNQLDGVISDATSGSADAGGGGDSSAETVAPAAAPPTGAPAVSAPPVAKLSKNRPTTFTNGQTWQLDANGQPKRIA